LIIDVDIFFKRFENVVSNIFAFRANSKFQFVHAAKFIPPKTACFSSYASFHPIYLFDKAFSTFHVAFIKIIKRWQKEQKRLLKKLL